MTAFISSSAPNLRVITQKRRVAKFRGGRFETQDPGLASEVREFAARNPHYAISEVGGTPVVESEPLPNQEGQEDTTQEGEEDTFDAMTVEELKDELRERDLKVTGNRADLIARLRGEEED